MERRELVVLDAGNAQMQRLEQRLRRMGYGVRPAKTPDQAERLLSQRGDAVGACVIPVDLPAFDLGAALRFLRRLEPSGELSFVAAGQRPSADKRELLREAGVELALWEPVDDHALRFQTNRALAASSIVLGGRGGLRAPANWDVSVFSGERRKPARVYSLSRRGAYLATWRPSLPDAPIAIELPFKERSLRLPGRVVMTNVPGHFMKDNLPVGMGIRFEELPDKVEGALDSWANRRLAQLGF